MKKYLFLLACSILLLGCSDSAPDNRPSTSQYVYSNNDVTITIEYILYSMSEGFRITVYNHGIYCFQDYSDCIGKWPEYSVGWKSYFIHNGSHRGKENVLNMILHFTTSKELATTLVDAGEDLNIVPQKMTLKVDNTILDKNGDGIIDSFQN